jgi:hypothetical protein
VYDGEKHKAIPQVLELIRKKNNLKNTQTKRMTMFTMILIIIVHEYMRNLLTTHKIETARKEETEFRHFENPKPGRRTWMDINNVLGNHRKPDQLIELLSDDGVLMVEEKVRIADTFNEYFTSIGKELAAEFDDTSDSGVVHDRNLLDLFI